MYCAPAGWDALLFSVEFKLDNDACSTDLQTDFLIAFICFFETTEQSLKSVCETHLSSFHFSPTSLSVAKAGWSWCGADT